MPAPKITRNPENFDFKADWIQPFDYGVDPTEYLEDIYPEAPLFGDLTESYMATQGAIGNCGTIAAIAAYSEVKARYRLEEGIVKISEHIYAVRFAKGVLLRWVLIDSLVPVYENGTPRFCRPMEESDGIWPSLLEKARATVRGGAYDQITNYPIPKYTQQAETFSGFFPTTKKKFYDFEDIREAFRNGAFAVRSWPTQRDEKGIAKNVPGLVMGHAFAVVDADTAIDQDGMSHDLLQIENPWRGGADFQGQYHDDSEIWQTIENSDRFLSQSKHGGSWWMSLAEYYSVGQCETLELSVPFPTKAYPEWKVFRRWFSPSANVSKRWINWKSAVAEIESPIKISLKGRYVPLRVTMSWLKGDKGPRHSYFFVTTPEGKTLLHSSGYGWWRSTLVEKFELAGQDGVGEIWIYPLTIDNEVDEGVAQVLVEWNC